MSNRTLHVNTTTDTRALLSTIWIAVLLAGLFRDVHEILRPGFVEELARDGTVYGTRVTDGTLLASGFVLAFLVSIVVLARVLPYVWNRRVNIAGAALMAGGTLATWPKDPDDLLFGAFQLAGVALVVAICARWRESVSSASDQEVSTPVPV